ncbi:MAG: PIN domain-containing protein [Nitrospira sp.]|nr:PIN domain-containing protein [Nitrospira sp.]
MSLDNIETGAYVFIDANIFIYHFTGVSNECSNFLIRCEDKELNGLTSANVILEVLHRLMMIEAVRKNLVEPPNIVNKLKKHPEKIKQLHEYYLNTQKITEMGIIIHPVTSETILKSHSFRTEYGFMVNDSLLAACMQENSIQLLATNDDEFLKIKSLTVFSPKDIIL